MTAQERVRKIARDIERGLTPADTGADAILEECLGSEPERLVYQCGFFTMRQASHFFQMLKDRE